MGYCNGLSFNTLREANKQRLSQFKNTNGELAHSKPDGSDWSPAEWLQALTGELGELANMLKKVKRGDFTIEEGREAIAKEFADVAIYLDLFAYQFRIDLGEAVREKFNEVSHRVNVPVFIGRDDDWHIEDEVPSEADAETRQQQEKLVQNLGDFLSGLRDETSAIDQFVDGFLRGLRGRD